MIAVDLPELVFIMSCSTKCALKKDIKLNDSIRMFEKNFFKEQIIACTRKYILLSLLFYVTIFSVASTLHHSHRRMGRWFVNTSLKQICKKSVLA
jgi:hypothetical protein